MIDGTGAELASAALASAGVDAVHVVPGEETIDLVDAIDAAGIDLVVCRHEQHACFMAAAAGRLSGRPGVVLATLGPGATNLVTGLAHADLGGMPLLAITGQKPTRDNREGSFQVVDVPALARPVTKWAASVTDAATLPATLGHALADAARHRPGPVLVEIPEDVAVARATAPVHPPGQPPTALAAPATLHAASARIDRAERPVVLVSAGANRPETCGALERLASTTGIGVVATQLGKGALPEDHPGSLRTLGIHEPDYAHLSVLPADLVVAVGYQPVEHPPLSWNPDQARQVIHVADFPADREPGYEPALEVVGELARSLEAIADGCSRRDHDRTRMLRTAIEGCLGAERRELDGPRFPPGPLEVVYTVRDVLGDDDVLALDNGVYKLWFARHYPARRPGSVLLDNALATMGAGLATAMTASRLASGRRVLAVCGDGGFLMNLQDLETAVRCGLDLTLLVLSDDGYGFIRWHQQRQGVRPAAVSVGNPDFCDLAEAFGAHGRRVAGPGELGPVLARALDEPGVTVVDCPIDYADNSVYDNDRYALAQEALRSC